MGCLGIALSYLTARLGGALILRPQMVSPLWLGNVLLVSVLLLVPRRLWPVLLTAGLTGFFLYDLQARVPIHSLIWLILSNAVEVIIAAFCLHISFGGMPRLNSVKALAKYSFYGVFLAPFVGAFLGALSARTNYWTDWKVAFFSEALGFLALLPAISGWTREIFVSGTKAPRLLPGGNRAVRCLVGSGESCFRRTWRGQPSSAALLSGAAALVDCLAFRNDRSEHFDFSAGVSVDLGRGSRRRVHSLSLGSPSMYCRCSCF